MTELMEGPVRRAEGGPGAAGRRVVRHAIAEPRARRHQEDSQRRPDHRELITGTDRLPTGSLYTGPSSKCVHRRPIRRSAPNAEKLAIHFV